MQTFIPLFVPYDLNHCLTESCQGKAALKELIDNETCLIILYIPLHPRSIALTVHGVEFSGYFNISPREFCMDQYYLFPGHWMRF